MKFTYYHNPRCSKSREGLKLLEEKGIKPTIKEYLKEKLDPKELKELFKKLKKSPLDAIRTKESIFKELELKGQELSEEEWINLIVKNPVLLERPILVSDKDAIIGRPPEDLFKII